MKMMDFSVIFCRVGQLNSPTPELNVVGLVKIHPLFISRVSEFDRVQVGRIDGYLHSPTANNPVSPSSELCQQ